MEQHKYQRTGAYPEPKGLQRNVRYARILLGDYSGVESELTAITQYIYHHLAAVGGYPELSDCLRGIAVVEMKHLDLLGKCIRQLGLEPRFVSPHQNGQRFWNAGFIYYGRTIRGMVSADIQGEREAIRHYESVCKRIDEPQIQALIRRIIEDEQLHIEILEAQLRALP